VLFKIKTVYFTKEHKKYLKELEQYKECEFDFREIYEGNIDYDYNDACTKYNKKNCQDFFKSYYKYSKSCSKTYNVFNYFLLKHYSNDEFDRIIMKTFILLNVIIYVL